MNFFPDFAPNSRKLWRVSLLQSNLRKQIRNLPKILNFVKKIHYYSELFTSLLGREARTPLVLARAWRQVRPLPRRGGSPRERRRAQRFQIKQNWQILRKFYKNFRNFWRARSRLYQNEILQENMRVTAFFKLYKISILLHRCNLKIFAKNRFEKTAIFVKFQQKNCKCRKICKIVSKFKKFSLRIW